jgi:hypothetical protein
MRKVVKTLLQESHDSINLAGEDRDMNHDFDVQEGVVNNLMEVMRHNTDHLESRTTSSGISGMGYKNFDLRTQAARDIFDQYPTSLPKNVRDNLVLGAVERCEVTAEVVYNDSQ